MIEWKTKEGKQQGYYKDKLVAYVHKHGDTFAELYPHGYAWLVGVRRYEKVKDFCEGKDWCNTNFDPVEFDNHFSNK